MTDAADGPDYESHSDTADEIGLLAHNINAPQEVPADLSELGIEYEEVDALTAWTGQRVRIYRYKQEGETRWAATWGERVAIDDVRWDSLIFNSRPDKSDIETAAEIINVNP